MKAFIVQTSYNGPWRWCIVDHGKTIASTPREFNKLAWARFDFQRFIKALAGIGATVVPNVQMEIAFPPPRRARK